MYLMSTKVKFFLMHISLTHILKNVEEILLRNERMRVSFLFLLLSVNFLRFSVLDKQVSYT